MLRVQMAHGDALVVKGGDPSYRAQECFRGLFGRNNAHNEWMTEEARKDYGWGPYADEPFSFGTIEMYVTSIASFYDQVSARQTAQRERESADSDMRQIQTLIGASRVRAADHFWVGGG